MADRNTGSHWWERAAMRCRQTLQTVPETALLSAKVGFRFVRMGDDPVFLAAADRDATRQQSVR